MVLQVLEVFAAMIWLFLFDLSEFIENFCLGLGDAIVNESVFLCSDFSTLTHRIECQFYFDLFINSPTFLNALNQVKIEIIFILLSGNAW